MSLAESPEALAARFLEAPLFQRDYDRGFGTLFTAEYDPGSGGLVLKWPSEDWRQSLREFSEGSRTVDYCLANASENDLTRSLEVLHPYLAAGSSAAFDAWLVAARRGTPDWTQFGALFAAPRGT